MNNKSSISDSNYKNVIYDVNQASPIDYYNIIFAIDSILSLKDGWEIKYNEAGLQKYKEFQKTQSTVVGVLGNGNKGKSFLLQRISGRTMISGYSVKTEGLSIVYPNEIAKNIICLDTAGLDTPILETDEYKLSDQTTENEILNMISVVSRDKQLTELFLQNFVISQSNILIVVVGQLTNSDQKLINRVKKDCKKKRKLYIVHNLNTLYYKSEVEKYIEDTLMISLTFKLHPETFINLETFNEKPKDDLSNQDQNQLYYVEDQLIENKDDQSNVVHLIIANEESEAGKYYNQVVYNYLKQICQTHVSKAKFDIIEKVTNHLFLMSSDIMEDPIRSKDDLEVKERFIKLNGNKTITLKQCLVNELGYSLFLGKSFVPKYHHYVDEEKMLFYINVELSGEITQINSNVSQLGENYVFKIEGIKPEEKLMSKYGGSTKDSGPFELDIRVPMSMVNLKNKSPVVSNKDGIFTFVYEIQEQQSVEQDVEFEDE